MKIKSRNKLLRIGKGKPEFIGLIILAFLFVFASVSAQSTLPFDNFTMNDGLPSSEVYHVMQDSKGFMWFSTDHGVCRYDGYNFKTYTTAEGLADNTIFECIEDYKGRIWFRSFSGRLSYFYNDSVYSLADNEKLASLLHMALITSFAIDSSDNMYVATQLLPGIIKIDLKVKNSARLIPIKTGTNYLIKVSGSNQLIIGSALHQRDLQIDTNSSFVVFNISSKDSFPSRLYELPLRRRQRVSHIHDQAIKLPDNEIVFSYGEKLVVTRNSKIVFQHAFAAEIDKICLDKTGKVWVAFENTYPKYYFNGGILEVPSFKVLSEEKITSVNNDNEGGLWLTSLKNGVYYLSSLDIETRSLENGLTGNKICLLKMAPDSSLWIAASTRNVICVLKNDSIIYHTIKECAGGTTINSILFHNDNTIWVSSGQGVFIYNTPDFARPLRPTFDRGVKDMVQNADNSVWANCTGNIIMFRRKIDTLSVVRTNNPNVVVKKMLLNNKDSSLWLGTLEGLYEYKNNSLINLGKKFPAIKKRIDDIVFGSNGELWMATRDVGLILKNKDTLVYFNAQNGLVSNFTNCLCFDYKGNLWVGTNTGLSHVFLHYDNKNDCIIDSIRNIVSPNLKEINCIACIKNIVYAGTNTGLVSFDMNKMDINKTPPPVYIMSMEINNKEVHVNNLQSMNLNYEENNIVIKYVGLTYRDHLNTLYRYKMNGLDTGWTYTQYTVVQYPKLPPGDYSFMVSARNSDGVWSKGYATVSFIITPPFWNIWWVKSLGIILIILLVYWRILVVLKRDRIKAEANQKLTEMELRELRGQMDPHFLFNNLNTLSYLVESKSNDAPVFVEELSKYFRYSLQSRNLEFTELRNELKQAERYLHLLRIRYGDKLVVKWEIDDSFSGYFISNHCIQLLLENITKHNGVSIESPLFVEIKTTENNTLVVKNNLQPKIGSVESTGMGLKSIDERYHLLYKRRIKITKTHDLFYVELPLLTPDEYEGADY